MSYLRATFTIILLLSLTFINASETIEGQHFFQDEQHGDLPGIETTGEFPIQSFVKIQITTTLEIREKVEKKDGCPPKTTCEGVETLLILKKSASSGVISWSNNDVTIIMTAGHSCMADVMETEDVKIASQEFFVLTGYGVPAMAEVLIINEEHDLCSLVTKEKIGPPVEYSPKPPVLHSKVKAIASPLGLGSSFAIPVFDGRYFGDVGDLKSTFGVPSAPGSSGGPIFNSDGKVVSVIVAVANGFHHFSIGTTAKQTYDFWEKSISMVEDPTYDTGVD